LIEKKGIAQEISKLMLDCGAKLDASVALVKKECGVKEFEAYRNAVSKIMTDMLLDVMNPLYRRHPEIKPKELK
jgi:hypothetical protein